MLSAKSPLRAVFMGTPDFSIPVLAALLGEGYEVVGVYTRPDRQTGRGLRLAAPPVKAFALERGLLVLQPTSLRRDEAARRELASLHPDVVVVAAYGLFLPSDTLALPRLGCLNIHPSLLPRHRGPSPVASAILSGDATTGVTIIRLDEGMDAGPIVGQEEVPIGPHETAGDLTARLFGQGARLLVEVLPRWERGQVEARPQDHSKATVTGRLSKEDGEVDWGRPATHIERQVRAFHPWPGCFTHWRGKLLKLIEVSALESEAGAAAPPGRVVPLPGGGVGVGTAEGILEVRRLQLEGRQAVGVREFVSGHRDFIGSVIGA